MNWLMIFSLMLSIPISMSSAVAQETVVMTKEGDCLLPSNSQLSQLTIVRSYQTLSACIKDEGRLVFSDVSGSDLQCKAEKIMMLVRRAVDDITVNSSNPCVIQGGRWQDPLKGDWIASAQEVAVTHVIPMEYARQHGGDHWSASQIDGFISDPSNQLLVSQQTYAEQPAAGPSRWMPQNRAFRCQYLASWRRLADKYHLSLAKADEQFMLLSARRAGCNPMLLVSNQRE